MTVTMEIFNIPDEEKIEYENFTVDYIKNYCLLCLGIGFFNCLEPFELSISNGYDKTIHISNRNKEVIKSNLKCHLDTLFEVC